MVNVVSRRLCPVSCRQRNYILGSVSRSPFLHPLASRRHPGVETSQVELSIKQDASILTSDLTLLLVEVRTARTNYCDGLRAARPTDRPTLSVHSLTIFTAFLPWLYPSPPFPSSTVGPFLAPGSVSSSHLISHNQLEDVYQPLQAISEWTVREDMVLVMLHLTLCLLLV